MNRCCVYDTYFDVKYCLCSLRRQDINSHDIDYIENM